MSCSCGKSGCNCTASCFSAPMNALWTIYDAIGSKADADVVSIAWERE